MGDGSTGSFLTVTSSDGDGGEEGSGCEKVLQCRSFLCRNNAMMV